MTEDKQPRPWMRAFPRSWRDRYAAELNALVDDLREEGDLRPSDRIDIVRSGLTMRSRHVNRRSLHKALGPVFAAASVLVGLALAGTFAPAQTVLGRPQTALGLPVSGKVIVLHARTTVLSPAQKAIFCTAAPITGEVTACTSLSARHTVPHGTNETPKIRSVTVGVRPVPQASREATTADR
jgi:hypothetical protein